MRERYIYTRLVAVQHIVAKAWEVRAMYAARRYIIDARGLLFYRVFFFFSSSRCEIALFFSRESCTYIHCRFRKECVCVCVIAFRACLRARLVLLLYVDFISREKESAYNYRVMRVRCFMAV